MEDDGVARLVAPYVGSLRARQAAVHEAVDRERPPAQQPLRLQALAHGVADLPADRVGRRQDERVRTIFGRQGEPAPARLRPQFLAGMFMDPPAQGGDDGARLARPGLARRRLQLRVLLAQHLVHDRRRHAGLLQHPEGLARIDGAQLRRVAHQRHPGDAESARDAQQRLHAHRVDHRGLVHRQHRAGELRPRLPEPRRIGEVAMAGEEPLQGARRDIRLPCQHPGCRRRGRETEDGLPAEQVLHRAQHGGLAAAGMALHAHDPVAGEQDRAHRLLLAAGEAALPEPGHDRDRHGLRRSLAAFGAHRRQHAPLGLHGAVGNEGPVRAPALRLHQLAAAHQARDGGIDLGQRMAPRRMAERDRADLRLRDAHPPFLHMRHRPRDGFQQARLRLV